MPSITVIDQTGKKVKKVDLSETVFAAKQNMQVVYDVVNAQRAALRQGTHDTKNRTEVSGGGRKPWRQKGTGRARQGSIRAPQWRGGGVVFGPTPRSYAVKVNKKVVKVALRSLLSNRFESNNILLVNKIELAEAKTKELYQILETLNLAEKKTIIITGEEDTKLSIASRNIPNVYVQNKSHLSVLDLINGDVYVMSETVARQYEEELQ